MSLRIPVLATPKGVFISVIIRSDELNFDIPLPFVIDTGAEETTISISSHLLLNREKILDGLEKKEVVGICGVCKISLIHNATLYFYSEAGDWFEGGFFEEIGLIPPRYMPLTNQLIPIPSLLGLDIIGTRGILHYEANNIYLDYINPP